MRSRRTAQPQKHKAAAARRVFGGKIINILHPAAAKGESLSACLAVDEIGIEGKKRNQMEEQHSLYKVPRNTPCALRMAHRAINGKRLPLVCFSMATKKEHALSL